MKRPGRRWLRRVSNRQTVEMRCAGYPKSDRHQAWFRLNDKRHRRREHHQHDQRPGPRFDQSLVPVTFRPGTMARRRPGASQIIDFINRGNGDRHRQRASSRNDPTDWLGRHWVETRTPTNPGWRHKGLGNRQLFSDDKGTDTGPPFDGVILTSGTVAIKTEVNRVLTQRGCVKPERSYPPSGLAVRRNNATR